MICIIAGNLQEAETWARSQFLARNEWFYPEDISDLYYKTNFHVLVIGSAGQNISASYFDQLYAIAQTRGRIDRW